jgi:poly(beta-D-mannuronate) lyase
MRGGTPVPASNTRYWDKPTYPTTGTIYASEATLNAAIATANPGDILRLANGSYNNMNIDIAVNGTGANPITVAAETKGGVSLTGQSDFDVTGDFINVFGFTVTGTNASGTEVFHDTGNDNLFAFNTISALRTGGTNKSYWFRIFGNRSRCCYNTCDDKLSGRSPFRTGQNDYVRIDHNRGIDILGDQTDGDMEFIQFDENGAARDNFCLGDNNYILRYNNLNGNRYFGGEREIFSNKSSSNMFIQNVLVDCVGHLFDRAAHRSTYYANWIDGGSIDHAGGIGLSGDDSYAFCNYITRTGRSGAWTLTMRQNGSNYEPSVNNQFAFNLLVDCESSMGFSTQGAGAAPNSSGIQVYNNAINYGAGDAESVTRDVYDGAGTWGGNVFKPPDGVAEATTNAEILAEAPEIELDAGGNCRGTGSIAHHALCTVDILGNAIPANSPNVGCFQDGWDLSGDPRQQIINEAGA